MGGRVIRAQHALTPDGGGGVIRAQHALTHDGGEGYKGPTCSHA